MKCIQLFVLPLLTLLFCSCLSAQGISPDQYDLLKSLTVENLERDTYIFYDEAGVILDRYELKPASVFHFSDDIERRVYLYLVYPTETEDTLGSMLFYQRENLTIPLPLPGADSPAETWSKYIDDLKYTGEDEPGFLACIGFVISREFAGLLTGTVAPSTEEGEYEYCFPGTTPVSMQNGSKRMIQELVTGDLLSTYDPDNSVWRPQPIQSIDIHLADSIPLISLWYADPQVHLTTTTQSLPLSSLTLTPNHPVVTESGSQPAGSLETGDIIFLSGPVGLTPVTILARSFSYTDQVYNLTIESGSFVADRVLVWPK